MKVKNAWQRLNQVMVWIWQKKGEELKLTEIHKVKKKMLRKSWKGKNKLKESWYFFWETLVKGKKS